MKIVFLKDEERYELLDMVLRERKTAQKWVESAVPDSDDMRAALKQRRLLGRLLGKLSSGH